jgi:hypothetical protein
MGFENRIRRCFDCHLWTVRPRNLGIVTGAAGMSACLAWCVSPMLRLSPESFSQSTRADRANPDIALTGGGSVECQ